MASVRSRVVGPARLGALVLGLALLAGPASALNFAVNSTLDTPDAVLDGVCATAGGVCTLRAAIQESNFGGAANLITFNLGAGPYSIAVGAAGLPTITRAVTINGYSQAGSSANTLAVGTNAVLLIELNGAATGAGVNGLTLNAPTTVRGLVINRFAGNGVQLAVGGATSVIAGNYVGTNTLGTVALGNNRDGAGSEAGIGLSGGSVTIGGTAPADRNLVSGHGLNFSRGIELYNSSGNTIQGNYVGTNAAGTARLDNVGAGIGLDGSAGVGSDNNLIGGAAAGAGNLISGGGTEGIYVSADSNGNTIQGNIIGRNATNTGAIANVAEGIKLQSPANIVGGDTPAKGNTIASNGTDGIRIQQVTVVPTGNTILGNRIFGNGALGIDLNADGVTNNDPLDADGGPNNRLNFPVITGVSVLGTSLSVSFSLDVPAGSYRVEFFRNPSGVDVPNGEGEVFAGFRNVTHGGGGSRSFTAAITGVAGDRITATTTLCTDGGVCAAFSDTSEFSANLIAVPTNYRSIGTAPDSSTGSVNTTNGSLVVSGVGTAWRTINRGRGDVISICDQVSPSCTTSTDYVVLGVGSDTQLTLTTPYAGSSGNHGYTIRRQFRGGGNAGQALLDWENCIDGGPCTYFGAGLSPSLVADNRSEVGIAYEDSVFTLAANVNIQGSTTDASHTITLTADGVNRHNGVVGAGVVVNMNGSNMVSIFDANVTIEWLELRGMRGQLSGALLRPIDAGATNILLQNLLIHDFFDDSLATINQAGIRLSGVAGKSVTVRNVMMWDGDNQGIVADEVGDSLTVENSSIDDMRGTTGNARRGVFADQTLGVIVRNTIATRSGTDFAVGTGSFAAGPTSTNNISSDATAPGSNPLTAALAANLYVNPGVDLHLKSGAVAIDSGVSLAASFVNDIDGQPRQAGAWDRGADELAATALYRSVGINGGVLASGGGTALTISGSTATFAGGLPATIGVGDVIQYDSDGNNSIDALAFIHGRTNSQTYTVANKDGAAPTAVVGDNNWGIYRAYTSLANWESQTENPNILEPVENDVNPALDLVTANTTMNVACYGDGADTTAVTVAGWTTGISNYIRIYTPVSAFEVGTSQRHAGTWNTSGRYRLEANPPGTGDVSVLLIETNYVRVDGLQVWMTADDYYEGGIGVTSITGLSSYEISNNIVRGNGAGSNDGRIGINLWLAGDAGSTARIWNNVVYDFRGGSNDVAGLILDDPGLTYFTFNNTVVDCAQGIAQYQGTVVAKNNIAYNNADNWNGTFDAASTHNLSGPLQVDAPGTNPRNAATVTFVNVAADDFHLLGTDTGALNQGTNLSADLNLAIFYDIDGQVRVPAWDIGADDANGTTAVKLQSFTATAGDASVLLEWRTGSELDNLGFYLFRSLTADGPWTRLNASLIPGLGSSAVGQAYSYRDTGLVNGTRHYYRLEDVDTKSKLTSHGPVWAVPVAGAAAEEGGQPGSDGQQGAGTGSCPGWVVTAYGSLVGSTTPAASLVCTRHGDPEAVSLQELSRDSRSATLELRTGGFYALHEPSGGVRVFVPGFDFPQQGEAVALPLRRALLEAVVGRRVALGGVRALEVARFSGLEPAALGQAEMRVGRDGTVRAVRREGRGSERGFAVSEMVKLLPSVFQGETKSAVLELRPLRYDARRRSLTLAKRVLVRLLFTGREAGESGRGVRGRRERKPKEPELTGQVLARLYTQGRGLYAVAFEDVLSGRGAVSVSQLSLMRQRRAVAFHVEPEGRLFGPGSRLYFYADVVAGSSAFTAETAWELVSASGGVQMAVGSALPSGSVLSSAPLGRASFEVNRFYQPGLLEAQDLWLWDAAATGATRTVPFALAGVDSASAASGALEVYLQGGSESGNPVDHHVRVLVNGAPVGEAQFAGRRPYRMSLSVPAGVLREGSNELGLLNVGDTGVTSLVFLDRFTLDFPELSALGNGSFEGVWSESGVATLAGAASSSVLLDVTAADGSGGVPTWLSRFDTTTGALRFSAAAGRRYLALTQPLTPRVASVTASTLRSTQNQADYLLIAPRAFLTAAEPLLARREGQGLTTRAVAFEEIAEEFGHGEPSAEAIKSFIGYAYQSWARPSLRYVLLLGDASYDPRRFMATSQASLLPALWTKTSYLWTASDPLLGAVNGEDDVPDLAIGRLPAQTPEEAQRLVDKLLAWEDSGQGLAGAAALVADNPDLAGDFEANVREIAGSYLNGRSELLLLSELGAGLRPAIREALDSGLAYLDYVGHGGAALWASENVWNSWDAASLQAQSRQPLLLTLNCLNGYFVAPSYDSLAESLVKAEGRGAIAAFSPSGLSLDGPAHQYHRALMAELVSGRHARLGDAILAAQQAYAGTGLMPELLSVYQLLGDPAMEVR